MEGSSKQIVLTGGGYAAIWAYRSIMRELGIEMLAGPVNIKVICPEEFHFFHGWTAESLMGIIQDDNRMSPLTEIFKHAEIIRGSASQVDTFHRIVRVKMNNGSCRDLPYDQLLLGTGAADKTAIQGLSEYAFPLKSHSAYLRAKMRIRWLVREAAEAEPATAQNLLRFVIAGSGYTGVEIASNLAEWLEALKKEYPILKIIKPAIYLINNKNEILPDLHSDFYRLRQYAEKTLTRYGIKIIHQVRIRQVTNHGVFLSDGAFIKSSMIISTIGQERTIMKGTEKMERREDNRILVNPFLQINHHPEIWGAGDAVYVLQAESHKACPSNALWAIKQGEHAGKNIARAILSRPLKPFTYKGLGQCASLGIGKGMGEIYGIEVTGWLAWIMRWFFFQYFMPSKKIMWREIKDWANFFITGRRFISTPKNADTSKIFSRETVIPDDLNQLTYQN